MSVEKAKKEKRETEWESEEKKGLHAGRTSTSLLCRLGHFWLDMSTTRSRKKKPYPIHSPLCPQTYSPPPVGPSPKHYSPCCRLSSGYISAFRITSFSLSLLLDRYSLFLTRNLGFAVIVYCFQITRGSPHFRWIA